MLIYLNGTSSSGKTSIAHQLQKLMEQPCFYFSIDTLLYSLASEDLEAIMGKRAYRWPLDWDAIFSGYFSSVDALVKNGNHVIADAPIYNEKLFGTFTHFLASIEKKFIVQVEAPLPVIIAREMRRGDRAAGVAQKQFAGIHQFLKYDFSIDTELNSPSECAQKIINHWNGCI